MSKKKDLFLDVPRWDIYQWGAFRDKEPDASRVVSEGERKLEHWPRFAEEVFHRLYSGSEAQLPEEEQAPEDLWAEKLHEFVSEIPEFEQMQEEVHGDRYLAGLATVEICRKVLANVPDPDGTPRPQDLRDEAIRRREEGLNIDDLIEQGRAAVQAHRDFANQLKPESIRQGIRSAIVLAKDKVGTAQETIQAFSYGHGSGTGFGFSSDPDEKGELARKVKGSWKLQQIAAEAGRLRRIAAEKQKTKCRYERSEVMGVEVGKSVSRALFSQRMLLCDPDLEPLFLKKLSEGSLLQRKLEGKAKQGRGPVVVCVDVSGSMQGRKEAWSKGMALALLWIAQKQKRSFRLILFDDWPQLVVDFPAGRVDQEQLLQAMESFSGGGTSFSPALDLAKAAIETQAYEKADVILITDGLSHESNEWLEEWARAKKRLGFLCYGIMIGYYDIPQIMDKICDTTIGLLDVSNDKKATDGLLEL